MKISLNWIKKYIPDLEIASFEDLKEKMISAGLDIESIQSERDKYRNFIVGEVEECEKHPNADKLTICKVNTGTDILSVVCGAQNVSKGQKVCLAKIGAKVPNGGFEIKKSKLRGELSEGMICAEDELGLSEDHTGIMVLNQIAKTGMDFADYLGADDFLIEIGITPNRGDLFSHIGIAREIAALYDLKISLPEINLKEEKESSDSNIDITIESLEFCKRFTGRVVKNVVIRESPEWLKKALLSIGLRPRNNIVDITNYVMMETGQPLHAFDYDKIREKKIIVKTAKDGDKFVTLDSKERILNSGSLMVCDGEGYSAIAGIMGGELSEITENTKNVFIESAYFDPVSIRKNSKNLGLQTDASQRFERGVDIEMVDFASNRAVYLMHQLAGGKILSGIIDVYPGKFDKLIVGVRKDFAEKVIGVDVSEENIINLLDKIEIKFLCRENGFMNFKIPEFRRMDITREIDLIEEIARMYGYNNIQKSQNFSMDVSSHSDYGDKYLKYINKTREHFIGKGFNEIVSYSQQDEKIVKIFSDEFVKIENPISTEMNVMRVNLLYGVLSALKLNLNNSGKETPLKLFEIGRSFRKINGNFTEEDRLCFALCGKCDLFGFDKKERDFDFFDIKGELETYLSKLNLESLVFIYYNSIEFNVPVLEIFVNKLLIGKIYIVSKDILEKFDIEKRVYAVEIYLKVLYELTGNNQKYKGISKFPPAKRDIALLAGEGIKYSDIKSVILKSGGSFLKNISLFDIYTDEKLGEGNKSMAFSLEFSAEDRTLTDEEVNRQVKNIINALGKELNITLRN